MSAASAAAASAATVDRRRRLARSPLVWLGAAAVFSVSVGSRWWAFPVYDTRSHVAEACQAVSVGSVLVTAWVLARRRPDNRLWGLTLWFGLGGLLQDLQWPNRFLLTVGLLSYELPALFLVWLSLAFPTGTIRRRLDRVILGWVIAIAVIAAGHALVETGGPENETGHRWRSLLALRSPPVGPLQLDTIALWLSVPGGLLFLGRLVSRAVAARHGPRRVSLPLLVAAFGATVWFLAQVPFAADTVGANVSVYFFWVSLVIQASIPIAFAAGALADRWSRSVVAELMLELDGAPPGSVEPALARVLRDPGLHVLLRRPDGSGYVRPDGTAAEAVSAFGPSRRAMRIGGEHDEVGLLVYDAELDSQPAVLRSTLAAARFALDNERLHADLQAQMRELRASRARVVEASDAERRRIERNLHDGVQQRLYTVGMELDGVRRGLGDGAGADDVLRRLEDADAALRTAIEDLRDVAHGIDPPVLVNRGLEAALRSRTRRSAVPVVITTDLAVRLPAHLESAAYYVASEAFANAERHAGATRIDIVLHGGPTELVVRVLDDGIGGADPTLGSGLRGLVDRAHAFDGTLRVDSPPGVGTCVEARFPMAADAAPSAAAPDETADPDAPAQVQGFP